SKIFKSLKVSKDGTLPVFEFSDVFNYITGEPILYQKNIQDLFKVNLLDFDIP
ncbi:hypothetical protein DICPUDRAFT_13521, partial [Dictyostelium purpureum]